MTRKSDFAEWLSPMVVKELRQGLRSRGFVIAFLLLQAAMIFLSLLALAASAHQSDIRAMTVFFWVIIGVPLLLMMPFSGLGSVANERKANSLELIFLTRLTPRRIIAGKWLAIVAQTALFVCAVLPYAVLRYFLGGVDVGGELFTLGTLMFASVLLSGIAVGFSPQMSRLARVLLPIILFFSLQFMLPLALYGMRSSLVVSGGSAMKWPAYLGLVLLAFMLLLLMLEFGASKVAPAASNHSTSRRLIGLAALLSCAVLTSRSASDGTLIICTMLLLIPICIGALCESHSTIAAVYRPFVKRGAIGKLAGRFLYPGWPSGLFYCVATLLILLVAGYNLTRRGGGDLIVFWTNAAGVAGALLFPAALNYAFLQRLRRPVIVYVAVQAVCAILAVLSAALHAYNAVDLGPAFSVVPLTGLLLVSNSAFRAEHIEVALIGMSIITAASFCVLLLKMRKPWREIRELEKLASALPLTELSDASERRAAE
jgi:hypothetical protein